MTNNIRSLLPRGRQQLSHLKTLDKRVAVIGGGLAGLAAACCLTQHGCDVSLYEKNESTGGRARHFDHKGFVFDMGPSWYWMPEVMEQFFNRFGQSVSNYFNLVRLDPSYRIFFHDGPLDVPASRVELDALFESLEPGSSPSLKKFLAEAKRKYDTGMGKFVWKPSLGVAEYLSWELLGESFRLDLLSSVSSHVQKYFRNEKIIQLLEFPVLFLGAKPSKTPALYTMMNYADMELGTWYPMGGMCQLPIAMTKLAEELGVTIHCNSPIEKILTSGRKANGLLVNGNEISFDVVVATADYHHVESSLLYKESRTYSDEYWSKRVMSPSCLIYYVGVNKKVDGLLHHNLFFDQPFAPHGHAIYDQPSWPDNPQFYVCCPSKTDASVAPSEMENLFILIPLAPGLASNESLREKLFEKAISRIELLTGSTFMNNIVYKKSYAHEEFISDYNAFMGNAYGLANTLRQTAFLKPRMQSKKISNLFFAGQLTVPGPGVPPAIISGQIAARIAAEYASGLKHS